MLKLLSSLNILQRVEVTYDSTQLETDDLRQGSWITTDGAVPSDGEGAYPIWTESNRDATYGWTPDYTTTGKLTVLVGTHRAITDQYTGTITAGMALKVDTTGNLAEATVADDHIVAMCESVEASYTYLGTTYSGVITYVTT